MLNQMQKTVCALAVLASTALPALAESIAVKVMGTINPTACTPAMTGGGTIDYGTIKPNTLTKDDFTALAVKEVDFSITCDAPAKVAVKVINGRPDTLAGVTEINGSGLAPIKLYDNQSNHPVMGLGLNGTQKIGGYGLRLHTPLADAVAVRNIESNNSGANWTLTGGGFSSSTTRLNSWSSAIDIVPISFKVLNAKMNIQVYINKASELDLTKPVQLDGLSTIELVYL